VPSLALGIGANTAIFTLIHQLILQPLPVPHPEQVVMLAGRGRHYGGNNGPDRTSYPMYREIRDRNQVFSRMFCTYPTTVSASFQGRTTDLLTMAAAALAIAAITALAGYIPARRATSIDPMRALRWE